MIWNKESKYSVVSDCGRYRICWAGPPDKQVYTLSKGNDLVLSGTTRAEVTGVSIAGLARRADA